MSQEEHFVETPEQRTLQRGDRRAFFTAALGVAATGAGMMMFANPASAQTVTDTDILNFALNLEYLEANFYGFAANGAGLASGDISGTGTAGAASGARQLAFADPLLGGLAKEMAATSLAQVKFLRTALGDAKVAQPAIDLGATPTSAFSNLARNAGLIGAGAAFDPYADDNSFLLGAFIFADLSVTAYKGLLPFITNKTYLEAAAGILAAKALQASTIRTQLYRKGIATPSLIDATELLSDYRDSLDGGVDIDQGVRPATSAAGTVANIAPLDGDGIAFGRLTGQVLNVIYLNRSAGSSGGFFPAGLNGTIKTAAAS